MLILNPRQVRFGSALWENIAAIVIDRTPQRTIEEFGDLGPYATFADVPEQRVRIRIIQQATPDGLDTPRSGDQAVLTFQTSRPHTDSGRATISAVAVILSIEHELSLKKGAVRTITLAAISETGGTDPITVTA